MPMVSTKKRRLSSPRGVNISTGPRWASSLTATPDGQARSLRPPMGRLAHCDPRWAGSLTATPDGQARSRRPPLDDLPQPVELKRELARLEPAALDELLLLAFLRCPENLLRPLGGHHRDPVGIEHDQVAGPDLL